MSYRDPKTGRWASPPPVKVFVYGTLKMGHGNNCVLGPHARFIAQAETCGHYRMYTVGFPVIIEDGDGLKVRGELYEVPGGQIRALDRLEGEGRMYDRKVIECTANSGGPIECYAYVGREKYWRFSGTSYSRGREPDAPNEDGLHEWTRSPHGISNIGFVEHDEVIEPEDQDQGDVEGYHDERSGP